MTQHAAAGFHLRYRGMSRDPTWDVLGSSNWYGRRIIPRILRPDVTCLVRRLPDSCWLFRPHVFVVFVVFVSGLTGAATRHTETIPKRST